jgi:hypothetical protein
MGIKKRALLYSKIFKELGYHLRFLPEKIRNRYGTQKHYLSSLKKIESYVPITVLGGDKLWDNNSTLPGNPECLPANQPENWLNKDLNALQDLYDRKLKILSKFTFCIRAKDERRMERIRKIAVRLPINLIENYKLIDWHKDFRSDYVWEESQFYLNVKVAPEPGVEIKIPRELSRFQHIGLLASGSLSESSHEFLLEVLDWIVSNPYGYGVNWGCTMDVALRAINWIWGLRFFGQAIESYPEIISKLKISLHQHGCFIENNLEYYESSTGNHYLSNIAGLIYIACAFPEFPESDRWLLFGLQELVSEMNREVYNDGASHEGSTNYHRLVAELFLSSAAMAERLPLTRRSRLRSVEPNQHKVRPALRNATKTLLNLDDDGRIFPKEFYISLSRMADFTESLVKPNGLVPQIGDNDSARVHKLIPDPKYNLLNHGSLIAGIRKLLGQPLSSSELDNYEANLLSGGMDLEQIGNPAKLTDNTLHKDAGIAIMRKNKVFLLVTCGQNGQNGRGGHNHNDKLSFELNINGLDIIVDGGCPIYTADPKIRNKFRGTAAHSTLMAGGQEQDKWSDSMHGLFVLRERSFPRLELDGNIIKGEHFGYTVKHRRKFELLDNSLNIEDKMNDERDRKIWFNFHPEITCEIISSNANSLIAELNHINGLSIFIEMDGASNPQIADGSYSEGYGIVIPNQSLSVQMTRPITFTKIIW